MYNYRYPDNKFYKNSVVWQGIRYIVQNFLLIKILLFVCDGKAWIRIHIETNADQKQRCLSAKTKILLLILLQRKEWIRSYTPEMTRICTVQSSIMDPDPDPGEQKWPTNIEKSEYIFKVLDVLFWGLMASPVAWTSFMDK